MQNYQTKIQNKDKEMFENQALNAFLEWVFTFNIHFGSSVLRILSYSLYFAPHHHPFLSFCAIKLQ